MNAKLKLLTFAAFALLAVITEPARAQAPAQAAAPGVLGGYAVLSVTATTGRVALPASLVPFGALTIYNNGAKDAYFNLGSVTVTATTSSTLVAAGKHLTIWLPGSPTHLAAICGGADTTSLGLYQSSGLIDFGP